MRFLKTIFLNWQTSAAGFMILIGFVLWLLRVIPITDLTALIAVCSGLSSIAAKDSIRAE